MRIHTFSLPYEYREVGRRYTRGDGASSQELFLNKPVSKGSKIAEVEVRMEELFCIALKRSKVSLWHAEVHGEGDGKMVEGRGTGWRDVAQKYWKGEESGRQLSTNYIARSCFCLPPSPPPLEMFRGTCSTTYPVHGNISPLKTFGISRIIVRAFLSSSETKRIQQCRIRITSWLSLSWIRAIF